MTATIISAAWLHDNLEDPNLIILDASPQSTISGKATDFGDRSISGARRFDLAGKFSDQETSLPNTVPSAAQFEVGCRKLGINKSSSIVVYDNLGIYTSPRVWWLFKLMGHDRIAVLDGGLPEWIKQDYVTQTIDTQTTSEYETGDFRAKFNPDFIKTYDDILENTQTNNFVVVDARSAGRFAGTAPEPRKGLKSGSMTNSVNIPFEAVLEDGKFRTAQELTTIFNEICGNAENLVFSCGSGLTACIIMLASELSVKKGMAVYDGSWTEWAERQGLVENVD